MTFSIYLFDRFKILKIKVIPRCDRTKKSAPILFKFDKVQSIEDKVQTTRTNKKARPYRPTSPATPLKKNSNNLVQKTKLQLPIQPKITTSTTVIPKTKLKTQNTQPKTPGPYDPQNPYKKPQSGPKDITVKDIEKDLIENDPLLRQFASLVCSGNPFVPGFGAKNWNGAGKSS
jgi:hypothetical protein